MQGTINLLADSESAIGWFDRRPVWNDRHRFGELIKPHCTCDESSVHSQPRNHTGFDFHADQERRAASLHGNPDRILLAGLLVQFSVGV